MTTEVPATEADPFSNADEDDDDLPAVGRVWEGAGPTSIFTSFRKASAALSSTSPEASQTTSVGTAVSVSEGEGGTGTGSNITPVDAGDFAKLMTTFHSAASEAVPGTAHLIENGKIVEVNEEGVVLQFPASQRRMAAMLERGGKRDSLQQVLTRLLGRPTGLRYVVTDDPDTPSAATKEPGQTAPSTGAVDGTQLSTTRPETVARRGATSAGESSTVTDSATTTVSNNGIPLTEELRQEILAESPLARAICDLFQARFMKLEET